MAKTDRSMDAAQSLADAPIATVAGRSGNPCVTLALFVVYLVFCPTNNSSGWSS
jgi:hypothetical protein